MLGPLIPPIDVSELQKFLRLVNFETRHWEKLGQEEAITSGKQNKCDLSANESQGKYKQGPPSLFVFKESHLIYTQPSLVWNWEECSKALNQWDLLNFQSTFYSYGRDWRSPQIQKG